MIPIKSVKINLWLIIFFLNLICSAYAADLVFSPATPLVEINKTVTLSVSGATGQVEWLVSKGKIQGTGNQVTYIAPDKAGFDVVTVLDGEGNTGTVRIVITPPSNFSLDNAQWEVFTNRSNVQALLLSEDGKTLWVGTEGGLEKRDAATGELLKVLMNTDGLSDNNVRYLENDGQGGLWVSGGGTLRSGGSGLAHYNAQGQWQVFNTENSGLPHNHVNALQSDNQGGLWIGTFGGGLAHLTFGRKTELCTKEQIDTATCQTIQQGQRAVIIVAAGGAKETDPLWESTEAITTRIYHTFYRRGFDKSQIYYLSPKTWADFDGDGFNDRINRISEERITLDDLTAAFKWAKAQGKLNEPLYFFFMDHGGEGKLTLSNTTIITPEQLKTLFDDYQKETGNQMIAVIEACHSGSFLAPLATPQRAIITSAKANEKAYFFEKKGFSRFLAEYLLKGESFYEAFSLANRDQEKLRGKNLNLQTAGDTGITPQTPQLDDNQDGVFTAADGEWLKQVYVTAKFTTADATLAIVTNLTPATTLTIGQPINLQAKVTLTQGTVKRVWAVIRPPAISRILDTNGTPILAFPRLELVKATDKPDTWESNWQEAVYNGKYQITFYAEDNDKNIASSEEDTVLTVTGGIDPPAQAQVQIHLEKDRYQREEKFTATLTEELSWGYDLYAAVVMPDGNFLTLNKFVNDLRAINQAKPWYGQRKQHQPLTLFDLTLPANLPTGRYCLYGILSPEQNDVFVAQDKGLWVWTQKCFEVD